MRYLNGSFKSGLKYTKETQGKFILEECVNAYYVVSEETRKYLLDFVFTLFGMIISLK